MSDKTLRIKPKKHSILAKAVEDDPSEFSKDTTKETDLLRWFIISIEVLSNLL